MTALRLLRLNDLYSRGFTPTRLATAVRAGRYIRVRAGVYADGPAWATSRSADRVVARARALAEVSKVAPIFSSETAAGIHGLPLHRPSEHRVHVIAPESRPGRAEGVIRHRATLGAGEVVEVNGLRCTSLERTLADVARTAAYEQAVSVADAVLRRLFVDHHTYQEDAAVSFCAEVLAVARRSATGAARAARVLDFADGRAELPGESISRIRLDEVGFAPPGLQVRVPGPGSQHYFVDFELPEANAFGEFDGRIKYADGRLADGRTASDVFDREKQREDWIRGVTQRRLVRWGWADIASAAALAQRLAKFGVYPQS